MKKLFLLPLSMIAAISAFAQPTLTGANLNPVVGDKFYGHICDATGISKGASGAGVTWNLAGLTEIFADTTTYVPCTGTFYCDSFPGSTMAVSLGGGDYQYFITDAAKLAYSGIGVSGSAVYFSDFYSTITYPMTYATVTVDSYFATEPANSIYHYGIDSLIGDAWGTLILPTGTYTNVLRVRTSATQVDSDLSGGSPVVDSMHSFTYNWYATSFHNPLLTMTYDSSGGVYQLTNVEYYTKPPLPSHAAIVNTNEQVQVYPNPANGRVTIKVNSLTGGDVSVSATDIMGRSVGELLSKNRSGCTSEIVYSVAGLPAGIYLLHIQSGGVFLGEKITGYGQLNATDSESKSAGLLTRRFPF